MQIRESEFPSHIRKYKNVLYLCHRNADPDAIGSAFALQQAFGGTLGAVEDLSRSGEALASSIGAVVELDPAAEDYDIVVIVDASVRLQLGNINLAKYALVDHHLDEGLLPGAEFYIQRPSHSTAEIVWKILRESEVRISREIAMGLMVGLISDTGRFRRASPESFGAAADILQMGGIEYEVAQSVLFAPTELSQRIAVLKAASRAEVERIGDWIIATTEINSFEGSSAMSLVDLGADMALAAGRHGHLTRVSGRASRDAISAGLNLARLLREVAKAHGGEGGGHKAAAALEAEGEPSLLLEECKRKAADLFRSQA
jgi:nanoRNase/pAp phosphatase (c-di-AMP/oligoRNAs hydrolase)